MSQLRIRKVAVLGAGVMGAQIAAHLVNANVETILFDLPAKEGDKNGIVAKAIANLGKLSPAPLAAKDRAAAIVAANYDQNLEWLKGCDLIIEAIAERPRLEEGPVREDPALRGPEYDSCLEHFRLVNQ
jgi:3-hydroxyacyl-CoA dehydrogenase